MIKYLENDFETEIKNKRLLIDFYAEWCGPCRMMGNILEEIKDIDVLKINVDKYPDLAQKYGVMSIPTIILMDDEQVIRTNVGFISTEELLSFIKKDS